MKSKIMKVLTVAMILAMSMVLSVQSEESSVNFTYAAGVETLELSADRVGAAETRGWRGNFWGSCCKCRGRRCKASKMCRKQ
jgi:hypothetical protein